MKPQPFSRFFSNQITPWLPRWRSSALALFVVLALLFAVVEPVLAASIAFGTQNNAQNGNNNSLTITTPSSVSAGNLLLAQITVIGGSSATITAHADWTLLKRGNNGTNIAQAIYYRIATGSEQTSYTWSFDGNRRASGGILRYSGVDTSSLPFVFTENTGNGTTLTATGLTTTVANSYLVTFFGNASTNTLTEQASLTERYSIANTQSIRSLAADQLIASAGATGNRTASVSFGGTNWIAHAVELRPDTSIPTVSNVTSSTSDGTYNVGSVISVQVTFSENVYVTGTPQLTLETGATDAVVNYSSGSGTNTLTFNYTVAAGHTSADLDYTGTSALALNGGTIRDGGGNNATLTLAAPGAAGSLGDNKALVIDGVAPTVTNVTSSVADGTYGVGAVIPIEVTFSEVVNVTGTPRLTLETGATDAVVDYTSGTGTNTLTFAYTVAAGHASTDLNYVATNSLALNGGTIRDAALNNATLTLPALAGAGSLATNKNIVIDTTAPTVASVNSSTANGTYGVGAVVSIQVNFSENVIVTGLPQLTLETGASDAVVDYASGSGTTALTFNYTVAAGHASADLDYTSTSALALNGGAIKDAANNNASLTLAAPGAANSLGANKAIVIDGVAPTVSNVTSSTANGAYDAGALISIQVVFSENVIVTGVPQLTLETGATDAVVNYTSGSGTTTLTFEYTVVAGHNSPDLDYVSTSALALNGGAIKDAVNNDANLTLPSPGGTGSLGLNKDIIINTTGVIINPTTVNVTEGGATAQYSVVLKSQPADTVFVQLDPSNQVTVNDDVLEFTTANWNTPQNVTVTAVNDAIDEGPHNGTVAHTATSADPLYNGISIASVTANITDNDTAGVEVSTTAIEVTEGAPAGVEYTVVLKSQPTANVTIALTVDPQADSSHDQLTFTPNDWNVAQTVTISALDDQVVEAQHIGSITHTASSTDPKYNGISVASITLTVNDNDTGGVTVTPTTVAVAEGDTLGAQYTVVLLSEPTADVTINLTPDAQVNVNPLVLTFTSLTWNQPQPVTVTAVDDVLAEGPHTGAISHAAVSSDSFYNNIAIPGVTANITDNDVAGVFVSKTSVAVTEGGATDTYQVVLTTQPVSDVKINVSGDAQASATPTQLTFTNSNWNTAQTVTVSAIDDLVIEGPHQGTISHNVDPTSDPAFTAVTVASVTVNITDNDVAGVIIDPTTLTLAEGDNVGVAYTAKLTLPPTQDVTIHIGVDSQVAVSPASLTFTSANWSTPQSVTVTAVDDFVDEDDLHLGIVSHTSTSTDLNFDGLLISNVTATITDNDTAGVSVAPNPAAASEGGTGSYQVALLTQPTANVTINLSGDAQSAVSPASLTFTPANWNTGQTVTVTPLDDTLVEGDHTATITHAAQSADAKYNGIAIDNVTVNITDNDLAGVTISPLTVNVVEGGASDTYSVVLTGQPSQDVVVTVTPDAQSEVNPNTLTFTNANWNQPQMVTVTAVDDAAQENNHQGTITHSSASAHLAFDGLTIASVTANIIDNDTPGVSIVPVSLDLTEGGIGGYTVVLTFPPTNDVTISITPDAQSTVNPTSLTFTPANWNIVQNVSVTAVDDVLVEGAHTSTIQHSITSNDAGYAALTLSNVVVNITDNDLPNVVVTPAAINLAEGGPGVAYTIMLSDQPTDDVTITATPDGQSTVSPASLTFTGANWNTPQSVTVTAVNDAVDEDDQHTSTILHSATSNDARFGGQPVDSVVATISDNDTAGVSVNPTSVEVTEGGATATYQVVLLSQPTANVTININPDAQVTASPNPLVFTAANWNSGQTVTVAAVNDVAPENPYTGAISHLAFSDDAKYSGITVANVTVKVNDNDQVGVSITPASVNVAEGGPSANYTVKLTSPPTANVTITINPDTQSTVSPSSLTFTTANWNTAQNVAVTAVNDEVAEGAHTSTISHVAASADSRYNGIAVASVTANITDNDTAGVNVNPTTVAVSEAGQTATYQVSLKSQPTANVAIAITPGAQISATPQLLTFTPLNWNVSQVVKVGAVDDSVVEGDHSDSLSHAATSSDGKYNGIAIASVTATISDNDAPASPAVIAQPTSLTISEPAGAADFTITLGKAPAAPVTVNLSVSDASECSVPASVTLDGSNWQSGVAVTVSAVDDAIDDGAQPCTISGASTSSDADYAGLPMNAVVVTVNDDEVASLSVEKTVTPDVAGIGDTVTYRFRIVNTGSVALSGLVAIDNKLGSITLDRTTLQPGQLARATVSYVVQASDLPGPLNNTLSVTANSAGGNVITGSASASVTLTAGENSNEVVVQPGQPATLSYSDPDGRQITVQFPAGAVNQTTKIVYQEIDGPSQPGLFQFGGLSFTLTAYQNDVALDSFTFEQPFTLVIDYKDSDVAGLDEDGLTLFYLDKVSGEWSQAGITVLSLDTANNRLTVQITHLTEFALGVANRLLLPIVGN
jgi:hypothetical protein